LGVLRQNENKKDLINVSNLQGSDEALIIVIIMTLINDVKKVRNY
jgi:hypothetical protein